MICGMQIVHSAPESIKVTFRIDRIAICKIKYVSYKYKQKYYKFKSTITDLWAD